MGKVLWHATMSLDGFIAGPKGEMDWMSGHPGMTAEEFMKIIQATGAAITGRRSYDVGVRQGHKVYGGAFTGPVFVLTHEPPATSDPGLTFLNADITDAVAQAKAVANGKNVALIGANVAKQAALAGLVDEVLIHVVPVLVGDGTRLFDDPGSDWIHLEPISVNRSGHQADLRYSVRKDG
ncbi:deaminase [Catellatospora sp. TT07R-123]|uniref:dihydrofolate reductase family protein n=1 Tax=Catellatospora sp. TT07R-123 TaxID=2733863 RepID=UPI001B0DD3DB|nr:dihydrofolate reductase family protein [Catellatospora sp. TT07R-123]GHJ44206.1 deaminase [Catellatospora sp. TT07R-123]